MVGKGGYGMLEDSVDFMLKKARFQHFTIYVNTVQFIQHFCLSGPTNLLLMSIVVLSYLDIIHINSISHIFKCILPFYMPGESTRKLMFSSQRTNDNENPTDKSNHSETSLYVATLKSCTKESHTTRKIL